MYILLLYIFPEFCILNGPKNMKNSPDIILYNQKDKKQLISVVIEGEEESLAKNKKSKKLKSVEASFFE